MDKKTSKIVDKVETYLRESANMPLEEKPTPNEIELHITKLFIINLLVSELFSIEVIPIDNSYLLRLRNNYASVIMRALPMFCKKCGMILEPVLFRGENGNSYLPYSHSNSI